MPLVLSFEHESNQTGHIVIDRDNFIIKFHHKDMSIEEIEKTRALRNRFQAEFIIKPIRDLCGYINIYDPRHDITDHLCKTDKNCIHLHVKFNRDLTLEMMLRVMALLPDEKWEKYMSHESLVNIMDALHGYFCCPEATLNELEHSHEKNRQLQVKNEAIQSEIDALENYGVLPHYATSSNSNSVSQVPAYNLFAPKLIQRAPDVAEKPGLFQL